MTRVIGLGYVVVCICSPELPSAAAIVYILGKYIFPGSLECLYVHHIGCEIWGRWYSNKNNVTSCDVSGSLHVYSGNKWWLVL